MDFIARPLLLLVVLLSTAACAQAPVISGVSPIRAQANQQIVISGSGFGTHAPYTGDTAFIQVVDDAVPWAAGHAGDRPDDMIFLVVSAWADVRIVLDGFRGVYGRAPFTLAEGHGVTIKVWNPQTGAGPAVFHGRVAATAPEPAVMASAASGAQHFQVTVPAEIAWVDTGITVQAGQWLKLSASGQWSNGGGQVRFVGPDGFGRFKMDSTLLPSASLASLIGRIDSKLFFVGSNYSEKSAASGRLYLSMNDVPNTFGDNKGSLTVSIDVEDAQSLVARSSLTADEQHAVCGSPNVRAAMQVIENQQANSLLGLLAPAFVCGATGVCEQRDDTPGPRTPTVLLSRGPSVDGGGYTKNDPGSFICQALVARAKIKLSGGDDLESTLTADNMNKLLSQFPNFEEGFKVVPLGGGRFRLTLINPYGGIRMPEYPTTFSFP